MRTVIVFSALLLARDEDGEPLSDGELRDELVTLLVAGHETTANLIGNGMLALGRHPAQMERLRREPSLMPRAVEFDYVSKYVTEEEELSEELDYRDLAPPRAGEVLVRLVATGVCHSDLNGLRGTRELPLPMVLGHEGAGIVEAVGPSVTTVAAGDHVVLAAIARCGKCARCVAGKPWLCSVAGANLFTGTLLDGTTRLSLGGRPVYHWFSQSSFAERAVVPEGAAVKVRKDVSLEKIATLACGVSTGLGAVLNAARVEPGASVVVIGCGGVGVSAIVGADLARARGPRPERRVPEARSPARTRQPEDDAELGASRRTWARARHHAPGAHRA